MKGDTRSLDYGSYYEEYNGKFSVLGVAVVGTYWDAVKEHNLSYHHMGI